MESNATDRDHLCLEIKNYLRENPNAGDSLKGVMSWWTSSMHKNVNAVDIEEILEQLITEGSVRKIPLVDGTFLYKMGNQRFNEKK